MSIKECGGIGCKIPITFDDEDMCNICPDRPSQKSDKVTDMTKQIVHDILSIPSEFDQSNIKKVKRIKRNVAVSLDNLDNTYL